MPPLAVKQPTRAAAAALGLAALAAAGSLAAPAPAAAALTLEGRGFGHGVGMSQYGAYGFAVRENRSYDSILRHYYTGTQLTEVKPRRIHVLLKRSTSHKLCDATRAGGGGDAVDLSTTRCYRFSPVGQASVRVMDLSADRRVATLRAPVRVTGGSRTELRGRAENGLDNGEYRGALELHRSGGGLAVINDVHSRHYLYGVIPAEVPTSWPIEALKAQAVAARSYAFTSLRPGQPFDVYADTRSQVYRGFSGEDARAQQAVQETREEVVTWQGAIVQAFFFSTSGGRTTSNENGFGGAPLPYLRPVDDPHDDLSPVHTWTARFSDAEAGGRLGVGTLESLRVTQRDSDDRVRRVEVRGSRGTKTLTGAQVRAQLGLRSNWFTAK